MTARTRPSSGEITGRHAAPVLQDAGHEHDGRAGPDLALVLYIRIFASRRNLPSMNRAVSARADQTQAGSQRAAAARSIGNVLR